MKKYVVFVFLMAAFLAITMWVPYIGRVGVYPVSSHRVILTQSIEHLEMVAFAVLLAIGVGVPLGVLVTRPALSFLAPIVIGTAGLGQAIPSMALIVLMYPLLGLGYRPALVGLVVYALLPILRNTYAGIRNIDPGVIEAARGMGMSRFQITRRIQLPLARPVIMAGIRTSTVVCVGTATLAVLVGAGGLGRTIITGVRAGQPMITLGGAAPVAALAILLDYLLQTGEELVTPRGLKVSRERALG